MLSEKIEKAFNDQLNAEYYSAYLYFSMAAYFDDLQLPGFAHWLKIQGMEEKTHALRFYNQIYERGGKVTLAAIAAPPTAWDSPLACFEDVLAHEIKVTGLINNLVALARQENDYASENFLQWFISEQVEEEASATEVIGKLKLISQDMRGSGLLMLNQEMSARVFVMPPTLTF
ncbi:MAG: ferritin [Deltaproteobacteria bacterium]|nr:ferritin [Deltaproteobacteria bacterium]